MTWRHAEKIVGYSSLLASDHPRKLSAPPSRAGKSLLHAPSPPPRPLPPPSPHIIWSIHYSNFSTLSFYILFMPPFPVLVPLPCPFLPSHCKNQCAVLKISYIYSAWWSLRRPSGVAHDFLLGLRLILSASLLCFGTLVVAVSSISIKISPIVIFISPVSTSLEI